MKDEKILELAAKAGVFLAFHDESLTDLRRALIKFAHKLDEEMLSLRRADQEAKQS